MQEGRRGRNVDPVCAEFRNGLFSHSLGAFEIGLPDVSARDDTEFEVDLGGFERSDDSVDLLRLPINVEVKRMDRKSLQEVNALADSAVGGSDGDLGSDGSESLVDFLVLRSPSFRLVHDEDRLVDLDLLDSSALELSQQLRVNWDELVEQGQGIKVCRCLSGLGDEREVGDGTEHDGSGGDSESFGLFVLLQLLVVGELEHGAGRVGNLDDVVIRVKAER